MLVLTGGGATKKARRSKSPCYSTMPSLLPLHLQEGAHTCQPNPTLHCGRDLASSGKVRR